MKSWQLHRLISELQDALQSSQHPEIGRQDQDQAEQGLQEKEYPPGRGLASVLAGGAAVHCDQQDGQAGSVKDERLQGLHVKQIGITEHAVRDAPEQGEDDERAIDAGQVDRRREPPGQKTTEQAQSGIERRRDLIDIDGLHHKVVGGGENIANHHRQQTEQQDSYGITDERTLRLCRKLCCVRQRSALPLFLLSFLTLFSFLVLFSPLALA